jgi:CBS domain-containing protein
VCIRNEEATMTRTIEPYRGGYLAPPFAHASVADIMHPGVMSCAPRASLVTVARTMATHHVHAVVVGGITTDPVHGEHLVWGLISDMDLVRAAESGIEDRCAEDIARTEAITVDPATPVRTAAQLMSEHRTSHLIVAAGGEPIGIISSLDIAGALGWGGA